MMHDLPRRGARAIREALDSLTGGQTCKLVVATSAEGLPVYGIGIPGHEIVVWGPGVKLQEECGEGRPPMPIPAGRFYLFSQGEGGIHWRVAQWVENRHDVADRLRKALDRFDCQWQFDVARLNWEHMARAVCTGEGRCIAFEENACGVAEEVRNAGMDPWFRNTYVEETLG